MSAGSFIPNKPVSSGTKQRKVKRVYLLTYVVYIFFAVTILLSGALWFYQGQLNSQLADVQAAIEVEQQQFDQTALLTLVDFDSRLEQAANIFFSRAEVTTLLSVLEEVLISGTSLAGLSYNEESNLVVLDIIPQFQTMNDALYRREIINDHVLFSDAAISGVKLNDETATSLSQGVLLQYTVTLRVDKAALQVYEPVALQTSVSADSGTSSLSNLAP